MAGTIKQIAEIVGVSRGTVDRALHGRDGVNSEVAAEIIKTAKELEYTPNYAAKMLATSKKRKRIDVIINSGNNPFFIKVLKGIEHAASVLKRANTEVSVHELTGYDVNEQLAQIEAAQSEKVDGLVITPINSPEIVDGLNRLAEAKIQIVTMNTDVTKVNKLCFVGCNYQKSGKTAAELMGKFVSEKTDVLIVGGSEKISGHIERVRGFCEAAKEYPMLNIKKTVYGGDNDERVFEITEAALNDGAGAIYFCAGGIDGGIRAIEKSNAAPVVITVDDTDNIRRYIENGIISATVCQQPFKQGHDAVIYLADRINDGKRPPRIHNYLQNEIKMKYNLD